jgi:hypothetical protein
VAKVVSQQPAARIRLQIVKLKASGADVFIHGSGPKFAAQGMKKIAELSWKPTQYVWQVSSSIGGVLAPAGIENTLGLITSAFFKDPSDPQWKDDKAMLEYQEWFKKYMPGSENNCPDYQKSSRPS